MVRRDGSRDHCFTFSGHGWADRFLAIVSKPVIADDDDGVGSKQLLLAGGHDGRGPAADRLAEIYLALSV